MKNKLRWLERYIYLVATLLVFLAFVNWESRTVDLAVFLAIVGGFSIVPGGYRLLEWSEARVGVRDR